jgi:hypothetical protein
MHEIDVVDAIEQSVVFDLNSDMLDNNIIW